MSRCWAAIRDSSDKFRGRRLWWGGVKTGKGLRAVLGQKRFRGIHFESCDAVEPELCSHAPDSSSLVRGKGMASMVCIICNLKQCSPELIQHFQCTSEANIRCNKTGNLIYKIISGISGEAPDFEMNRSSFDVNCAFCRERNAFESARAASDTAPHLTMRAVQGDDFTAISHDLCQSCSFATRCCAHIQNTGSGLWAQH